MIIRPRDMIGQRDDWLSDFRKAYGDEAIIDIPSAKFTVKQADDGKTYIEGYASTADIDRYEEIILPTAFKSHLKQYMEQKPKGLMLFMHGWRDMPLGRIVEATIDDKGLFVRGEIVNTTLGRDVAKLVEAEVLSTFSVGARVLKDEFDHETEIRTITDVELLEISVVNIPANPAAVFQQAKALQLSFDYQTDSSQDGITKKRIDAMDAPNVHADAALKKATEVGKQIGSWGMEETIAERLAKTGENLEELRKICTTIGEKAKALEGDRITRSEYQEFAEKFAGDLKRLHDELLEAKNAVDIKRNRMPITDWRATLLEEKGWLQEMPDGRKMNAWDRRAYTIFNLPFEKDSPAGEYVKQCREFYDYLMFKSAIWRYRRAPRPITATKEWEDLRMMVAKIDPEFATKAMYSTGAAVGDEWVPTIMSGEMEELYRLEPTIESWLRAITMPSNPYDWPIKVSWATAYRGSEAVTNNPPQAILSSFGTGKVTFTAEVCIAAIPCSPELIEDSLVEMVGELRTSLVQACADGNERGIINGDTAATHQDTTHSYTSTAMETAFLGLRAKAFDDSKTFDTQSTTAGVGDATAAFHEKDVRYGRGLLGVAGTRANELLHVCNVATWVKSMNFDAVAKANERGAPSTYATGQLETFDGSPIYITENMHGTGSVTGLETVAGSSSTWLTCNRRIVTVGTKRGITVEYDKDILTQQSSFVGTTRKDLQYLCADTVYPVALGFDI